MQDIVQRLRNALQSADNCTCGRGLGTISIYHAEDCRYRLLHDASNIIRDMRNLPYYDASFPPRHCDRCGINYYGPAVYCSFDCAVADAGK